jgi:hypothetical protein
VLNGRIGHPGAERLDIGGHMERLDIDELADLVTFDPGEELCDCLVVRHPGVLVADGSGEEFQDAPGSGAARVSGDRRYRRAGADRSDRFFAF